MPHSDNPDLWRTQLYLDIADVDWLRRTYGRGWTTHCRQAVHDMVARKRAENYSKLHINTAIRPQNRPKP